MKTVDGLNQFVAFKGYDSTATYSLNDVVVSIQNNEVKIYQSLADTNTSSLSDATKWKEISLGGGGGEIGDIGFAPLGIDESLNLRRYLNGQVISQLHFEAFTNKVKSAIALYPNLSATEENWQAEKTNSKLGQCGKFVIDDTAGTIRLPCVVNAQGLLSLSGIGNLVNESLPNVRGSTGISVPNNTSVAGAFKAGISKTVASLGTQTTASVLDFDTSEWSSTYQNYAPVQQEAIQYPYYIQVATGVEETLPAIREYEINTPFFFGQSMYSENAPYNASWLASNGSYNAASVYPDFWTQLTGVELNGSLNVGDTIEIGGKTYVKRGLPVKLSTDTYDDYDFVVNQNDQTFRLPLLNGEEDLPSEQFETWTLGNSGQIYPITKNGFLCLRGVAAATSDYMFLSQCQENETIDVRRGISAGTIGVGRGGNAHLYLSKGSYAYVDYSGWTNKVFTFNVAKGNGTLYYYVGDTVQDASLINVGAVLGQLATKTNNVQAAAAGMPSDQYIDLTVGASGQTYTAPANGYFFAAGNWASSGSLFQVTMDVENYGVQASTGNLGPTFFRVLCPVLKGEVMTMNYTLATITVFRFIYAKGEN